MHLIPPAIVFALILAGGIIAHTATGSPTVLLSVSGGVFLIALFAKHLAVALPIAAGTGLVTFAFALQGFVPWVGVAEALFLIAWAGSARVRHPIPAALAAGFFGALVLAFELWRGWTGDMIDDRIRPVLAIASAIFGILLLIPGRREYLHHVLRAVPQRPISKRASVIRAVAAISIIAGAVAITSALANPMGHLAAKLREAFGGAPADFTETETGITGGPGSRWSTDSGRPLPMRADVGLAHEFALLIRADHSEDAVTLKSRQIYCRTVAFERYESDRWLPPESNEWFEDSLDGVRDGQVRVAQNPPGPLKPISYTAYVPSSPELILPTLQGVFSFELPRIIRIGDSTFGHPSRLESSLSFRATSATRRIDDIPPGQLRPASSPPGDALQFPTDKTGIRIRALSASLSPAGTSLPVVVDRIRRHLRENTAYSTVIENPKNLPPLENFLFDERRGYCEFYASAGALLIRAAGFPARVAYGYSGGEQTADPHSFAFFNDDAHAWTEVFVEKFGWCIVDFTPEGQGAATPPAAAGPLAPRVNRDSFESLREIDLEAAGDWVQAGGIDSWNWGRYGTVATAAFALLIGGITTILLRREKVNSTAGTDRIAIVAPPAREPGFYRSFCDAAAKAGHPKLPGQTPKEHLAALTSLSPENAAKFADLVDYYYAVRYEGAAPSRSRERAFRGAAVRLSNLGADR